MSQRDGGPPSHGSRSSAGDASTDPLRRPTETGGDDRRYARARRSGARSGTPARRRRRWYLEGLGLTLILGAIIVAALGSRGSQPDPAERPLGLPDGLEAAGSPPSTAWTTHIDANERSRFTVDDVVYDMYGPPYRSDGAIYGDVVLGGGPWGAHEALPKGVPPDFDWYHGARPGRFDGTQGTGRAVSGWGQVFEAEPGTGTYDVRLQVRNHQMFWLLDDGRWVRIRPSLDDPVMEGAFWNGLFQPQPGSAAAMVRDDRVIGGGHSVSLAPLVAPENATWHFWWAGWYPREAIPSNAVGLLTLAEMRLIPDSDPDVILGDARFIGSVSADNYATSTFVSSGEPIAAVFQPRMKYLTSEWQLFSGTSLTEAQLRENPPPLP